MQPFYPFKFRKKMKKNILVLIFIMITGSLYAQFRPRPATIISSAVTVVDSGNVRVWYALNAVDIGNEDTYDDLQRLEIGTHLSKYFSHFVYNNDSLNTDYFKKHPPVGPAFGPSKFSTLGKDPNCSEYYYTEYFKDFSTNTLTEYARMPQGGIPHYKSSESIPVQNWTMEEDTMTVADYLCQKASCLFRGRNFAAWFTPEIPISNGPWKFGGLPGLILKVYDNERLYVFECIKIEHQKKIPDNKIWLQEFQGI
jgi:GLPGLI family protein